MKKLLLYLLTMGYLLGCAPSMVTFTENVGRSSIDLNKLSNAKIALLPLRSTFGTPVRNKTVKEYLCSHITQIFPQIKLIKPDQIISAVASKGREAFFKYREIEKKYITRGVFTKNDLTIFNSAAINYAISITLNSGYQAHFYPKGYLFLVSMQIWNVKTGEMVWDITQEGRVLIESEGEDRENRIELMRNLCDSVLTKLTLNKRLG